MKISIIVATAENNVIGLNGKIPWHIPKDLKRFREITTGHHILMGRKTYESIGKPLPERTNIILSKQPFLNIEGAIVFQDFGDAVRFAGDRKEKELFIIGGSRVYEFTLPLAEIIYQTLVLESIIGDVKFPQIDKSKWKETSREEHFGNRPEYVFRNLERR